MELLGFYDEPYGIQVELPQPWPRPGSSAPAPRAPLFDAIQRSRPDQPLVASLWESMALDETLLERWKPGVVARRRLGGRQLRLSVIVMTLVASAVLSAVLWVVLNRSSQLEAAATSAFAADVDTALATVPPLRSLAESLGSSDSPDLAASTAIVLPAEDAARRLFDSAGALAEVSNGEDRRQSAVTASGALLDATRRINRLIAYRLAAQQALVAPALEEDPTATDVTAAAESVAAWRVGVAEVLDRLPEGVLPAHRREMTEWSQELQVWQEEYLDAIREGAGKQVANAVSAQTRRVSQLHADLLRNLEAAGTEITADLGQAQDIISGLVGA